MSEVEELEPRIINLPPQDLAKLRDWFLELDNWRWDEQIASDFEAQYRSSKAIFRPRATME